MIEHRSFATLETGLENIKKSPSDNGMLYMIVVRPFKLERAVPWFCKLSPELGVEGDHWAQGCWKSLPDGRPDPTVQVTIMNSRCLELLAPTKEQWALAGDNLIVDFDLSTENLKPGQKISIGSAMLQISDVPHNGCIKFRDRFGADALRFISTKEGKELRLRGIYAQIIKAGEIRVGDRMKKV
jgi:MOSC domain-containing protein YiiM